MGAHIRDLTRPRCLTSGCTKWATCEVYNTFNSNCGRYCRRHGLMMVRELKKTEAAAVRAVIAER